jgi:hypothetical protein
LTTKTKFNPHQLRVGDFALIQEGRKQRAAKVISKGRTYLSPIGVKFLSTGTERYFNSRQGFDEIVGGARLIDGKWIAL